MRCDYSSTLDYALAQGETDSRRAMTINIGFSGLCLYLYESLAVGQRIIILNSVFPLPRREAVVKWIEEVETGYGIYKAGVEFCSS